MYLQCLLSIPPLLFFPQNYHFATTPITYQQSQPLLSVHHGSIVQWDLGELVRVQIRILE